MAAKTKIDKGALEIAGMICDALEKLPKKDREARLKAIYKIKVSDRRNNPKRASSRQNPREYSHPGVLSHYQKG